MRYSVRIVVLLAGLIILAGRVHAQENRLLTAEQRTAVGDHLRRCYSQDSHMVHVDPDGVRLVVTTDQAGTVRVARLYPGTINLILAERARRAVLDPACATLPLPAALLGTNHTFVLTFRP